MANQPINPYMNYTGALYNQNPTQAASMNIAPRMPQPSTVFFWVENREEAERYPLGANCTAYMMEKNNQIFYVKRMDMYGNPYPLEVYRFEQVIESNQSPDGIGREEFNMLTKSVADLVTVVESWKPIMQDLAGTKEDK